MQTHWSLALVQATAVSKTIVSWRSNKTLGRLVSRNPVTIATKIMAILSSAFRLFALQLFCATGVPGAGVAAASCRFADNLLSERQDDAGFNWVVERRLQRNEQCNNICLVGSGCVAQLVEQSLPIPEVRGLNPVIGKNLYFYWTFVYCQLCIDKTKIKKKRPGMAYFKNNNICLH